MVKRDGAGLHCGELAKAAGVSPDTIRHYEKIGVLPKALRSPSGYRIHSATAIERVMVVQRALRIGFSLAELSEVLQARDAGDVPCRRVYELAQAKLKGITTDIAALRQTECFLKTVLTDWEQRMRQAGKGRKAHLLHSLIGVPKNPDATTKTFRKRMA
jgi:DNA-binding transcriptional MerR regulator